MQYHFEMTISFIMCVSDVCETLMEAMMVANTQGKDSVALGITMWLP